MPCTTGRSQHILCRPNCSSDDPCDCRPRDAFSAREFCCKDDFTNAQLTRSQVRDMICEVIKTRGYDNTANPMDMATEICGLTYPQFNCPIDVSVRTEAGDNFVISTINNGECITMSDDTTNWADGTHSILLDGIECTTFIVSP